MRKLEWSLIILATMLLVSFFALPTEFRVNAVSFSTDWPMFRHDVTHTGHSSTTAPTSIVETWRFITGGKVISSPAVVDGKVYFGSGDGNVYAVDASTGAKIWNYPTYNNTGNFYSSPAVVNGYVYIGSNGNLYCLDASTGRNMWNSPTGYIDWPLLYTFSYSSPVVANGYVYIGSNDGNVYAFDASTGAQKWSYPSIGSACSPAVADGRVFVASDAVYCLDAITGTKIWDFSPGGPWGVFGGSPAVVGGNVYIGCWDKNVYALDASTGETKWSHPTESIIISSPAVVGDSVYVNLHYGYVLALDASTGAEKWRHSTIGGPRAWGGGFSSPAVVGDNVFVGSYSGSVFALDAATGAEVWSYETEDVVSSSPAIVSNCLYIGSDDGCLYALSGVPFPSHKPAPPPSAVEINGGAPFTNSLTVTLTLNASAVIGNLTLPEMSINNTENNAWTNWEPYNTTKSWTLTSGDGLKTVYVKFRTVTGYHMEQYPSAPIYSTSNVYQASVTFDTTDPEAALINQLTATPTPNLTTSPAPSPSFDLVQFLQNHWIYVAIGIVVLVVAVSAVTYGIRRRKG